MQQLKTINWNEQSFIANGKKYFLEKELSIQRSVFAESAKIELESGLRFGKYTEDWKKIWDMLNSPDKSHFADIAIVVHDHLKSFNNFIEDVHPVIKLCACFINAEGEDRRFINQDIVNAKAEDWIAEGLTMRSFFHLALSFLAAEAKDLRSITEHISQLQERIIEMESAGNGKNLDTPIPAS